MRLESQGVTVADSDRMNGEALANHGRDHSTVGSANDWRHGPDQNSDREAAPSPAKFPAKSEFAPATRPSLAEPMGKVWLEVTEDKFHPEGGYALIRLHGLTSLPADATFTILPGDQHRDTGVALLGWPEGEHRPVSRRDIIDGIEIGVGPDVVDCPALLPGTPVIIDIASAQIRGEILWPSVASRPARPPAVIPQTVRRFPQTPGEIDHEGPVLSELPRRSAAEVIELAALPPPVNIPPQAAPDFSNLAALAASLATQSRNAPPPLGAPDSATEASTHAARLRESPVVRTHAPEALKARPQNETEAKTSAPAALATETPSPTPSIAPGPERLESPVPPNRSNIVLSPTRTPLRPVEPSTGNLMERPVPAPASVDRLSRSLAGIALFAALLAAGSSLMVLYTLRGMMPGAATASPIAGAAASFESASHVKASDNPAPGAGRASPAATDSAKGSAPMKADRADGLEGGAAVPTPAAPAGQAAANVATLFDILSPGAVSPRGRAAAGVDRDAALALADTYIHGDAATVDLKEGEFWIRHAVGRLMADGRLKWALTQLGTVYAAPGETAPDFEKARLMWQLSGALGDAVALCFLGNLHEYGLGVPASRDAALSWYERGRTAGGCKGNDEAIARVKR